MSLAIAETRSLAIAVDDRKAIAVASRRKINVAMLTTPELLHDWQKQTGGSDKAIGAILELVEMCARYVPPKSYPLRD